MKNTEVKDVQATPVQALAFNKVRKGMLIAVNYPNVPKVEGTVRCVPGRFIAVVDSKTKDTCAVTFNYPVRKAKKEYVQASQSYTLKLNGAVIEHHGPAVQGCPVTLEALTPEQSAEWLAKMELRGAFLAAKELAEEKAKSATAGK